MKYRKEIDGLRALALLSVVFYHAGFERFSGAFVMLDVFFVISGYLISSLVLKDLESNSFSLIQFYERRARRILPALFLVMFCCIPFAWLWLMPLEFTQFAKSLVAVCLFSSNFLFWKESGYFEPANDLKPLLHTWSLAVEEQFYLIFPVLFLLAWKWKRKGLFVLIGLTSILSLGIMQWGSLNSPEANYYLLPGRAWEFLLGMLITLTIKPIQTKTQALSRVVPELASLLGLGLLVSSLFTFDKYESFPSFLALIPLLGTSLIILFAAPTNFVGKFLSSPPLVGIGVISYSGYLWHQPIFAFTRHALTQDIPAWLAFLLIVLNFVLSFLSWKYVEQPFRTISSFSTKRIFSLGFFCSIGLILLGYVSVSYGGFPSRIKLQFLEVSEVLQQAAKNARERRSLQFDQATSPPLARFIEKWKQENESISHLTPIPLAFFGSSLATDVHLALEWQELRPTGIFGSGCSISPSKMTPFCRTLADTLFSHIKNHPNLTYLALYTRTKHPSELTLSFFEEVLSFWKPLGLKLIIFSQKPEFKFLKQTLERGEYPEPFFQYSDLSRRTELLDYLTSQGVHLVNTQEIFCKITGGACGFKMGPKNSFRADDLLTFDGHHLTYTGQKEFGRILIKTDPLFKQINEESKKLKEQKDP